MRVHNYYSDILSSLYSFINNNVLSSQNRITHVQYNLGNAATMLEYRDSYSLPSAIIKYEALEPWSSMPISPRTFQIGSNELGGKTDRYEVVYNQTKGIGLDVQMQFYNLTTSVTINCKSQMQAINIGHEINQRMPVDRLLNQFSFISFFELDDKYLNPMIFDVQNDFITNLFLVKDQTTNKPIHAFSYSFDPLVKLTSMPQISMDDVTRSEYQVVLSIEMYIQVPQYLISGQIPSSSRSLDKNKKLNNMAVGKSSRSIVDVPCYYNYLNFDINNNSIREIVGVDPSNIDPVTNKLVANGSLSDGTTYSITSDYIGINVDFNYSITYKGDLITGEGVLFVYSDNTSICRLSGDLYGNLLNPNLLEIQSTLSGIMLGNYNKIGIDNEPLVLDLFWFRKRPLLSNTKLLPGNWTLRSPAVRDVYSIVTDINAYKSELKFNETSIDRVSIITISDSTITKVQLQTPYILLPDGSFSFQILLPVPLTISGRFDKKTSFIESIASSDILYDILSLGVTPTWDILPYGASQFDGISLDIGGSSSVIPSMAAHDAFVDKVKTLDTNYVSIHSTLPYQIINNQLKFSIQISPTLTALDPYKFNVNYEVYMIHNGVYIGSATTTSFMIDLNSSVPTNLVFTATEDFRIRVLDNITQYTPLYFGIVLLPI